MPQPVWEGPGPFTRFEGYHHGLHEYAAGTFYVGASGRYRMTQRVAGWGNGLFILRGTFVPTTGQAVTPTERFMVYAHNLGLGDDREGGGGREPELWLEAGEQYSFLSLYAVIEGERPLTLIFSGPGCISFEVDACNSALAPGRVDEAYRVALPAGEGPGPFSWSLVEGLLPPGLRLEGGVLAGTPTTPGSYAFVIRRREPPEGAVDMRFSLTIRPPATVATHTEITAVSTRSLMSGNPATVSVRVGAADAWTEPLPSGATVTVTDGEASCRVVLDAAQTGSCVLNPWVPGQRQLTARFDGTDRQRPSTSAPVAITVTPRPAAKLERLGPDFRHVLSGRTYDDFTVRLLDAGGVPVGGAMVSFAVPADGPSCVFPLGSRVVVARTNADGIAAVRGCQANLRAGRYAVAATVDRQPQVGGQAFRLQNDPLTNLSLSGSGYGDLFFQQGSQLAVWTLQGAQLTGQPAFRLDAGERLLLAADLNHDGVADYVTQMPNGGIRIRTLGSANGLTTLHYDAAAAWTLVGNGDLDGDGHDDLVWRFDDGSGDRNPRNGTVAFWLMKELAAASRVAGDLPPGAGARLIGVQDIDGDGKSDLIWLQEGRLSWWKMDGPRKFAEQPFRKGGETLPAHFDFVGGADFYRDLRSTTLVFRNRHDGSLELRRMENAALEGVTRLPVPADEALLAVRDTNGDGFPDLVFQRSNGTVVIRRMVGPVVHAVEIVR